MKRIKKIFIGTLIALALIYLALLIIAYLPYETTPIKELAGKESRFIKAAKKSLWIVFAFRPNPFNRRAKLALTIKSITTITTIAPIQ